VRAKRRWIYAAIGAVVILGGGAAIAASSLANCEQDEEVARSPVQPSAANAVAPAPSAPPAPLNGLCRAGMAWVPGGNGRDRKDIPAFCMDLTEVTAAAFDACVSDGRCSADHPGWTTGDGNIFAPEPRCNLGVTSRANHPMNCVDWQQSATYCQVQGKRLPTEEEWEWAARGVAEWRKYPWGEEAPKGQLCWSGVEKRDSTCAVGSFPEGDGFGGIHDLAGNVSEWTQTNYDASGATRVFRGGNWNNDDAFSVRASGRDMTVPRGRFSNLGFRCVQ
jgi:formylglycine-generating enzyme required for sulfatase activity